MRTAPKTSRSTSVALRALLLLAVVLFKAVIDGATESQAQEPLLPVRCHVWGPFEVGAWSQLRVDVEVYEAGVRVNRIERILVRKLEYRDEQGYRLRMENWERLGVALGGRERQQVETQSFPWFTNASRLTGPGASTESELEWQGATIKTRVFEYETEHEGRVTSHHDVFHADRFPYFLGRLAVRSTQGEPDKIEVREYSRVIEAEVPIALGETIVTGVLLKTTLDSPDRSIVVFEELAAEVPGGLVSKRMVERNRQGEVVRREVVSLVDFGDARDWESLEEASDMPPDARTLRGRLFRRWNRAESGETSRN